MKNLTTYLPGWLQLVVLSLAVSTLVYLPFITHQNSFLGLSYPEKFNFSTILANFDSLNYIIAAKTGYQPDKIQQLFPNIDQPAGYFPAHFPGYPFLIHLTAQLPFLGYPKAGLLVAQLGAISFSVCFYFLLTAIGLNEKSTFRLAALTTFFPARWLVVKNVPSPEGLFLTTVILAILFFKRKNYFLTGVFVILAQTIKSPGILLAGSFGLIALYNIWQGRKQLGQVLREYWPLLATPIGLIAVFFFYYWQTGSFWAYFQSGDNIHLFWPPFQVFDFKETWVNTIWLEDVYLIYLAGLLLLISLWKKYRFDILTVFPTIFYASLLFVAHRDIHRYLLPAVPFLLLGGEKLLTGKKFWWAVLALSPALLAYAVNFISYNTMPVVDWTPYL